jgi:WD40 repeat protein
VLSIITLVLPASSGAEFSFSLASRQSVAGKRVNSVHLSPDGKWLVVPSGGSLRIFKVEDPANVVEETVVQLGGGEITAAAFSPDSSQLASVDAAGNVFGLEVRPAFRRVIHIAGAHRGGASAAGFTGDGAYLLTGGRRGDIKIWSKDGSAFATLDAETGHDREIVFVGAVDSGRNVVSVGKDRKILLWDVDTRKILRPTAVESEVLSAELGSGGKILALGLRQLRGSTFAGAPTSGLNVRALDKVQMFDTTTGLLVREIEGERQDLDAIAVTPDGAYVASGGSAGEATIWQSSSGDRVTTIPFESSVADLEFSRDGTLMAGTSVDGSVALFRISGVQPPPNESLDAPTIIIIITSPAVVSSGSATDRTVRLGTISRSSLRITGKVKSARPLKGISLGSAEVSSLVLTEAGEYLFSGTVPLDRPGPYEIEIHAEDQSGHVHREKLVVERTDRAEPPEIGKGRRLALIVGVSDYRDDSLDLDYAHKDAETLAAELTSPRLGPAAFRREDVQILLDAEATVSSINIGLREYLQKARENDFVLFFFAGHGVPDPNRLQDYYLMAHDSDPNNIAGTGLLMRHVREAISAIPARDVLILTDACHSAGIGAPASIRAITNNPIHAAFLDKLQHSSGGLAILTASEASQYSQESEQWDGHGVFSWALLKGLRGEADANGDRIVDLGEVMEFVRDTVKRETGAKQIPAIGPTNFDRRLPLTLLDGDDPGR